MLFHFLIVQSTLDKLLRAWTGRFRTESSMQKFYFVNARSIKKVIDIILVQDIVVGQGTQLLKKHRSLGRTALSDP